MLNVRLSQSVAARSHSEDALRRLYRQMLEGWNLGSGDLYASPFAEDAEFVAADGTQFKGRREIASVHQQLFDTFVRGTRLIGKIRSIRFLTSNVALVIAVGGTVMRGQSDLEPERNTLQLLICTKNDGEWQIAAFQNTSAQYPGRPEAAEALMEELRRLL